MKDEIKEILEALRDSIDDTGTDKVNFINWVNKIEDYITNLQEQQNQFASTINELGKSNVNLQEKVEDLRRIFGIWNNRKLIKKFNKEYDEEDKNKNPNRDYVVIYPDAEEVYKRYYDYKSRNEKAIKCIKDKYYKEEYERKGTFTNKLMSILQGEDKE